MWRGGEGVYRMKVIIAGGGTAGHINPALAIAEVLKKHQPDVDILYVCLLYTSRCV